MTEREWLLQLYEDVRAYFRYEAEPVKQAIKEQAMRKTVLGYQAALQEDDFDEAS
jgi:hypothetical protein